MSLTESIETTVLHTITSHFEFVYGYTMKPYFQNQRTLDLCHLYVAWAQQQFHRAHSKST